MGDISEYRGVIFIGTFITLLVGMLVLIPSDFAVVTQTEAAVQFESGFDVRGLLAYNQTQEINQTGMNTGTFPGFGLMRYHDWGKADFGHDLRWYLKELNASSYTIHQHGYTWPFGTWTGGHSQEFINQTQYSRGTSLNVTELEIDYDPAINGSSYKIRCQHFYFEAAFTFNNTAHGNFTHAIDNDGLFLVAGIDWDQIATSFDTWGIISGVLLFDLPGGLQNNLWVYMLVSVPLWLAALYISFIFMLRVIGAVFGGGGA